MIRQLLMATLLGAATFGSLAGQPCPEKPADKREQMRNLELGTLVRDRLEASGATVAYVARAGIDLRPYGLVYSHVGMAWRDHPKGRWFTYHLLNTCGTSNSELIDQSLESTRMSMVRYGLHLSNVKFESYPGVVHSLTDWSADGSRPSSKYDKTADEKSWKSMNRLFREIFIN